jgi:hypothetical protein
MTVREQLAQEIQQSPDSVLEEVLDFLLFLKFRKKQPNETSHLSQESQLEPAAETSEPNERPIWEIFEEVADNLPDEIVANLPTDGAAQHDHYLYGSPKHQP